MTRILITALIGGILSGIFGHFLLPVLRAWKAGIKLRKIGPTWHNQKAGTPVMGGLMFIAAALVCLLVNIGFMKDYSVFYVYVMALSLGIIGMLDDFAKIRHDENLGLTALQKFLFQMAAAALSMRCIKTAASAPACTSPLWAAPSMFILWFMWCLPCSWWWAVSTP